MARRIAYVSNADFPLSQVQERLQSVPNRVQRFSFTPAILNSPSYWAALQCST